MHIPKRMCVACRQMKPKNELLKIVKTDCGAELDEKQNKFGRGAYVCKDAECILNAQKRKAFSRHFKQMVGDEIYSIISEAAEK